MTETTLIVFDLDGTLVDTSGDISRVVNAVRAERGLPAMEHGEVMRHVGHGTLHLMARVLGRDFAHEEVVLAHERFVELYAQDPASSSSLYQGTRETLDRLVQDHALAVVSNKAGRLVRATLGALDLARYFDPALGGDEAPALKPAGHGLLVAMKARCAAPQRTVMVGDMDLDMSAGRAAGAHTVFATWGFGGIPECDPRVDARIGELPEILDVIDKIVGEVRGRGTGATPRG